MVRRKSRSALELIARDVGDDPAFAGMLAEEKLNAQVARTLRDARLAAGLTQKELAELIGSGQSVIARLEAADYEGHSLTMIRRIAQALDRRVEVRLVRVPRRRRRRSARGK